ncbi:HlyC/CorC family transporter [Lacibacter luteus]|uniref:HlyC/CorC family transporter n=1 Tax=Lacibacter luteus TaxID=2508719 RepID=A0A4Q1CJV4_9BACT|nr:hemolysin family protein [Lacibacter luteus]RXK60612.1 HlyC/CorC family transporter [Lacibacter luteus]
MNWYMLIWIGVSMLLMGFFAGLQSAFGALNRFSVELKKKQGAASGRILSFFIDNQSKFIGAILVGSTLTLVVFALLVNRFFQPVWQEMPASIKNSALLRLGLDFLTGGIIALIVYTVFKAYFRKKSNAALSFFARITNIFYRIFSPVASLFVGLAEWILKYLFDVRVNDKKESFTRVDLDHFVQQSKDNDDETQDINTELFENALSLPSVKVRECLIPRKEIVGVEANADIDELKQKFIETKLSKLIVYEGNIDNIVGYAHQLDMFRKPADIKSILLPIPAVPESMGITDLINQFTRERKSIAWVVDEFGGTSGIVTMEDLLEEIFGEIQDEYDTEEFVEKQLAENEFIFSGRLELDYLNEKYNLDFKEESDAETLSGYIVEHHETIPVAKDRIIIDDYEFDILSVSETRIETVKMKVLR